MAVMGFNAGAEMSQLRTQQTLAMQASGPATSVAATSAAAAPAAAGAASSATGPVTDAAVGAVGVQEPPATSKIIMQSVFKGAMTGASVSLGLKQFGPVLGKIGFLSNLLGKLPVADAAGKMVGSGLLGFLGKLPVLSFLLPKAGGLIAKSGIQGFLFTALIGAAVGMIGGAISGMKKAKTAQAEYAKALEAQQAAAQTPPIATPAEPEPASAAPPVAIKPKFKSWVIARSGTHVSGKGGSTGAYTTRKGDTVEMLAKRFHTTPAEIRKLNPGVGATVEPGTRLKLKRKVVPTATAWKA